MGADFLNLVSVEYSTKSLFEIQGIFMRNSGNRIWICIPITNNLHGEDIWKYYSHRINNIFRIIKEHNIVFLRISKLPDDTRLCLIASDLNARNTTIEINWNFIFLK